MEMDFLGVSRLESSRVAPSRSIEQLDATVCINRANGLHLQRDLVVCVMCNCTCAKGACHTVAPSRPESPRVARPCGLCDVMGEKAAGPRAHLLQRGGNDGQLVAQLNCNCSGVLLFATINHLETR